MSHPHAHVRAEEQKLAEAHVRRSGYKVGGRISDEKQDREAVANGVHKHERHDHPGKPLTPLRGGGKVKGHAGKPRADRFARGGKVKSSGGPAKVNIVIATGGGEPERQMAFQQGAQVGTKLGAMAGRPPMGSPPMPPRPPMGGMPPGQPGMPPPGGMPPGGGAPPMMPPGGGAMPPRPGMMKRGGRLVEKGGAGGGEGRLEKAGMADMVKVKGHTRRKAGGRVDCE
jgi:hypothetical protein